MTPEMFKVTDYILYSVITAGVTVSVGRILYRNGRVFLRDCFGGDAEKADSVNRLLLMGFHLVSFGALAILLKVETPPTSWVGLIETLSFKTGVAFAGLGLMHFFNMRNFEKLRVRAATGEDRDDSFPPPLPETAV